MKSRLQAIVDELAQSGTSERAEKEKSYLKSELVHLGVPVPTIRKITKRHAKGLDRDEAVALAQALWSEPVHERRMAGVEVLDLHRKALGMQDLPMIERWLREARTWALVDGLAVHVVGTLVQGEADMGEVLDRWAGDEDFWIRRSALLALLGPLRKGGGDWDRFGRYADAMLEEKELFIRKAIGWVLRETAKRRPELVVAWIAPRTHRASGVTMREVVKPLDETERARLMDAYRGKRPAD